MNLIVTYFERLGSMTSFPFAILVLCLMFIFSFYSVHFNKTPGDILLEEFEIYRATVPSPL